ncbi:D-erythronate dehydrogenase [Kushneria phosphatilytica]|uniref:SDR family oxidoreductase n=1 Tax=Kushneria phosphatilytica TaxID=657387 RepID=A0A1S1NTD3_9GAMM|nr:D-erythronate dehydrogenase [Kushneria phosphatilytica]OHV12839.1 NAD-dependent epimerase [Kushneria phosphatilytica]QEL10688.1 SDR family oxidoreductase [Kushneria phosphatilytica]
MHVVVTGGAGFVGARLIQSLLDPATATDTLPVSRITSIDLAPCPVDDDRVTSLTGDISDPALIKQALTEDTMAVCHLAAVVSSQAEAEFELGMRINLDATRALLEQCRAHPQRIRFLFASSLAVFGPPESEPVPENVAPEPRSSYGIQKAIGELLVNDYSRRGFVDGRVCRLPTVVVRPGRPNRAASSFASSIIREPVAGEEAICPVAADLPLWLSSPRAVVTNLQRALQLTPEQLDNYSWRTFNLPGLTVTVEEMLNALERQVGSEARQRVRFERDPTIEAIAASWPGALETHRAQALGLEADADFDAVVRAHLEETGHTTP